MSPPPATVESGAAALPRVCPSLPVHPISNSSARSGVFASRWVGHPGAGTHHCPAPGIFLQGLVNPQLWLSLVPQHARFGRLTPKCPFAPISALPGPLAHQATANEAVSLQLSWTPKDPPDPGWLQTSSERGRPKPGFTSRGSGLIRAAALPPREAHPHCPAPAVRKTRGHQD